MENYLRDLALAVPCAQAGSEARRRWNAVAKPIGALGLLEDGVVQIAELTGSAEVDLSRRCVAVLCADNGVVAQGVSQSGQEVTSVVASNIARGVSSVCQMCKSVGIDCIAVDMGMATPPADPRVRLYRIAAGTADITQGPAMSRDEALAAVRAGIELVGELASEGYRIVAVGEMGIGNTTTAAALACALTGAVPAEVVGRGAGLSDTGLARKVRAVERALEVNDYDTDDVVGMLAALGGFDLCGMCGMFLGGARYRVPVVIDGLISSVAALCALRLRPESRVAMLASHLSSEPAALPVMRELGMRPLLHADMHLGEGAGAACLIPLLDMALGLYRGTTFADCGIDPYEVNPQ